MDRDVARRRGGTLGIAESTAEFKAGLGKGPLRTYNEFIASLHKESKLLNPKKRKRPSR